MDSVLERIHILTVHSVPVLPVLLGGVPHRWPTRSPPGPGGGPAIGWLAQAAKVRLAWTPSCSPMSPAGGADRGPAAGLRRAGPVARRGRGRGSGGPTGSGPHTAWCNITGEAEPGPVAGFVVDAWTETIPATRTTSGIAVHFDRPSATAPNAVLLAVTRGDQQFSLDTVYRCVRNTLAWPSSGR